MALGDFTTVSLDVDVEEAREIADAALRLCVSEQGDEIAFTTHTSSQSLSADTLATLWLATETRAARLEAAYDRIRVPGIKVDGLAKILEMDPERLRKAIEGID